MSTYTVRIECHEPEDDIGQEEELFMNRTVVERTTNDLSWAISMAIESLRGPRQERLLAKVVRNVMEGNGKEAGDHWPGENAAQDKFCEAACEIDDGWDAHDTALAVQLP